MGALNSPRWWDLPSGCHGCALAGTDEQGWAHSSHFMPLLPSCGWTDTGKFYTCKSFCKGLQLSESVPPLLHLRASRLLGCLSVLNEVSKSSPGSLLLLFFFLTLQITSTDHRRTFSALLKRHDCRTRVMLVDSPCNVIPRWFAFIWKQAHLLGPGFEFPLQDAFQQWRKGV